MRLRNPLPSPANPHPNLTRIILNPMSFLIPSFQVSRLQEAQRDAEHSLASLRTRLAMSTATSDTDGAEVDAVLAAGEELQRLVRACVGWLLGEAEADGGRRASAEVEAELASLRAQLEAGNQATAELQHLIEENVVLERRIEARDKAAKKAQNENKVLRKRLKELQEESEQTLEQTVQQLTEFSTNKAAAAKARHRTLRAKVAEERDQAVAERDEAMLLAREAAELIEEIEEMHDALGDQIDSVPLERHEEEMEALKEVR